MRGRVNSRRAVIVAASLFCSGCAEELNSERFTTTRVRGVVRLGGKTLTKGWIEFWPCEGAKGDLRSAPIQPDGRFDADKVSIGRNVVGLTGTDLPRVTGQKFGILGSPIRRDIPAVPTVDLDIDLMEELARIDAKERP